MTILQKQKQIKYLNFYRDNLDGRFGTNSKNATKEFQRAYELISDGIFGKNTENKSIEVWKDIQSKLIQKTGVIISIDGLVGNKTIQAIKYFQRMNGLIEDGIIGSLTLAKLNEVINKYMEDKDWNNSKYFKKEEFKCGCNGKYCNGYPHPISKQLISDMNKIREHFGKPIHITNGVRCQKYNDSLIGSIKTSQHIEGNACDFYFSGINCNEVIEFCKSLSSYGYAYTNNTNMLNCVHYNIHE